jgi:hypothetical protein
VKASDPTLQFRHMNEGVMVSQTSGHKALKCLHVLKIFVLNVLVCGCSFGRSLTFGKYC